MCSRLCHDLAGPVGAVGAGLELMAGVPAGDAEALALAAASADQLKRRLAFHRVAFGYGGGDGGIPEDEARALVAGLIDGGAVALEWRVGEAPAVLDAATARLVLLLALAGVGALRRSGALAVRLDGDGVEVAARGPGARLEAGLGEALRGAADTAGLTARTVHGHLAALFAAELGLGLAVVEEDGAVRLSAGPQAPTEDASGAGAAVAPSGSRST